MVIRRIITSIGCFYSRNNIIIFTRVRYHKNIQYLVQIIKFYDKKKKLVQLFFLTNMCKSISCRT